MNDCALCVGPSLYEVLFVVLVAVIGLPTIVWGLKAIPPIIKWASKVQIDMPNLGVGAFVSRLLARLPRRSGVPRYSGITEYEQLLAECASLPPGAARLALRSQIKRLRPSDAVFAASRRLAGRPCVRRSDGPLPRLGSVGYSIRAEYQGLVYGAFMCVLLGIVAYGSFNAYHSIKEAAKDGSEYRCEGDCTGFCESCNPSGVDPNANDEDY